MKSPLTMKPMDPQDRPPSRFVLYGERITRYEIIAAVIVLAIVIGLFIFAG